MLMKSTHTLFIYLFISSITFGQKYVGPEMDIEHILSLSEEYSEQLMAHDFDDLGDIYLSNAKTFVTNKEIIEGRPLIKSHWTPIEGTEIIFHQFIHDEINVTGDMAYNYGQYQCSSKLSSGHKVGWTGKFLIVWKKVDNQWRIYLDSWNRTK